MTEPIKEIKEKMFVATKKKVYKKFATYEIKSM